MEERYIFWLVPAQNPDFTKVVNFLPISKKQKSYLLGNSNIQFHDGYKHDKVYISTEQNSWNTVGSMENKEYVVGDNSYVYGGEAKVIDGKVYVDTYEVDIKKYNL